MLQASTASKALTPLSSFFPKWVPHKPMVIVSHLNDIVANLSLEHILMQRSGAQVSREHAEQKSKAFPLLFLWRNRPCIVIGRNQNPFSECRMDNLKKDKVKLSRRDSGGGAVYQDLGNSVFTFIFTRQMMSKHFGNQVICDALKRGFNINAVATGRNDLCIGEKKFSGSAFKLLKDKFVHHGTIIRESNLQQIGNYLSPHKLKLKQDIKGSPSVLSRVTKLADHTTGASHEKICELIKESFAHTISADKDKCNVLTVGPDHPLLAETDYDEVWQRLSSHDWIYGTTPPFELSYFRKFDFGLLELRIKLVAGEVEDIQLFTDSMDEEIINPLLNIFKKVLIGLPAREISNVSPEALIDWVCERAGAGEVAALPFKFSL